MTLEEAFLLDTLRCRFKYLREEFGLTKQEASQHLDVPLADYLLYEDGETLPDVLTILHASALYKVSVDYLLGQTETPTRDF
ncbi:helix-turn-helix domain-containing protein [Enterococcus sp. DIV0876]|uniref:helix-turn-helix domain-containing protein n=1 Tax=Enterococcus sp. DIV0876 TaxID=2774633 RepID=UPI003D2FD137